jgi:hypothetical protein
VKKPRANAKFGKTYESFKKRELLGGSGNTQFLSALEALVCGKKAGGFLPPAYFGRLATDAGWVSREYIKLDELESLILSCDNRKGEAPVGSVLAEWLLNRFAAQESSATHTDLLDELIERSELVAASVFVERCPELEEEFASRMEVIRNSVLKPNEEVWLKAKQMAADNEAVALWVDEIDRLFDDGRLEDARLMFPNLTEAIARAYERETPEYSKTAQSLRDHGVELPADADFGELRKALAQLRDEAKESRKHIILLKTTASSPEYDVAFQTMMVDLIEEIDWPDRWPSPADCKDIHEALEIVLTFLGARARWRESQPERL